MRSGTLAAELQRTLRRPQSEMNRQDAKVAKDREDVEGSIAPMTIPGAFAPRRPMMLSRRQVAAPDGPDFLGGLGTLAVRFRACSPLRFCG